MRKKLLAPLLLSLSLLLGACSLVRSSPADSGAPEQTPPPAGAETIASVPETTL